METATELLEHTADVKLRVRAPSFGELAAEAGRAVARIEWDASLRRHSPHTANSTAMVRELPEVGGLITAGV